MKGKKMSPVLLAVCCLSMYLLHSITAGFNPATAALSEAYPDAALTTISLVASIAMFAAFPGNLVSGYLINRFNVKTVMYCACALCLAAGVGPFFLPQTSLGFLIFTRALVGFSYGLFLPVGATCVSAFFEGDKRAAVLGFGSTVSGVGGTLVVMLGGLLLGISLRHVFLYHLLVLIPLICTIIMPRLPQEGGTAEKKKADFHFNGKTWFFCIMQLVVIIFYYPTNLYLSPIAVNEGFGNIMQVSLAGSCLSIAAAVSGLLYLPLKKIFGKLLFGVSLLIMAAAMAMIAFGHNMLVMYIAYALIGLFYMTTVTCCTEGITISATPAQITTAVGIGFAVSTLGCLISVYVMDFLVRIFGQAGNIRFYFVICMAALALIGAVNAIRPVTPAASKQATEQV